MRRRAVRTIRLIFFPNKTLIILFYKKEVFLKYPINQLACNFSIRIKVRMVLNSLKITIKKQSSKRIKEKIQMSWTIKYPSSNMRMMTIKVRNLTNLKLKGLKNIALKSPKRNFCLKIAIC
jgi:hypothetical protein